MTEKAKALLRDALELGENERMELAVALLESLDPPADAGVEEAWREEIERRLRSIDAGEVELIPWRSQITSSWTKLREPSSSG